MTTIAVQGLTKRYGPDTVVEDVSFTVEPGQVTGFLGPNGAGKSTTMKMILGLAAPTKGSATIGGRRYQDLRRPLTEVGALLDAGAVHGGRKAYDHLLALAVSNGLPRRGVDEVLARTGLEGVAGKRAGQFSLGMRQRLGIAAALLGDPPVLIFDEPVNGLDPEGIRWIRGFMRSLAQEGRSVLVSSHLMNEMAQTADHLVIIGRGRLIADTSMSEFLHAKGEGTVLVRTSDPGSFALQLTAAGAVVRDGVESALVVSGMTSLEIGKLAAYHGVTLSELTPQRASLEDAFMELTKDSVEYQGAAA
ncbi:ABC transporter ATP-binding protein [Kibdelosporangium persicum]|uniref:ATPase component of ABC-type multidrug transport system n=1 Tax=Kibdelosporangium persicum TaxID=2698649 RepID=A0ABX2FJ00_9PSEU|nr:ATP-binding cassette domain-containing protein [Kibdelosporangium persicum]NRN71374.1 ATPase component of ABC-type multidrug transport system [Kibdelosporangium persicum]